MDEELDAMSRTLLATESCLTLEIFTFTEMRDRLKDVAKLGEINKSLDPDDGEEDPRNLKADAIEECLDELTEYMQFHSDDLKELKKDHDAYTKITEEAISLLKTMVYSLYEPKEFNAFFEYQSDQASPFLLGMKLIDLVMNDTDYPLNDDSSNQSETTFESKFKFTKWISIMEGFATMLLFLEVYLDGLTGDGKLKNAKKLKKRIALVRILRQGEKNADGYIDNDGDGDGEEEDDDDDVDDDAYEYNDDDDDDDDDDVAEFKLNNLRPRIKRILTANTNKSCTFKAELIKRTLEKVVGDIPQDDIFYILVFPSSDTCVFHANIPEQVLLFLHEEQCHVVIYRSREAKKASKEELKRMEKQVSEYKSHLRRYNSKKVITQSEVDEWAERIENNGFVIALKASISASIISTRTDSLNGGPGWWVHQTVGGAAPIKYILLAGFK